jgi:hypothetical protein
MSHPSQDGDVSAVLRPFDSELAEIRASGRTLSDDEWTDIYTRHDQYMVG